LAIKKSHKVTCLPDRQAKSQSHRLKNKKILITAGPTWVPLDEVRVISNTATGETGLLLAEKLTCLGAKVTLLLGPGDCCCLSRKIKLIRFKFFDDLRRLVIRELSTKKYDIVIHSAAVSDYGLKHSYRGKIKSGKKILKLNLVPTPKIIDLIKRIDRSVFLVGFKFEPQADRSLLVKEAKKLNRRSSLDLTVANTLKKNRYQAYIIKNELVRGPNNNKEDLTEELVRSLKNN
jgi:phosphopantothenoylcysteine decarboxylase/phosphopantothenate--cysteine ligase